MIRAVLDANVLASGFAGARNAHSIPGQLVGLWQRKAFELVVSKHIVSEVIRTLRDPYFRQHVSPAQSSRAAALLRFHATQTEITAMVEGVATHPEDDLVLATALSANVDYLVTGDLKLQRLASYNEVTILGPRQFLDILTRNE